MSGKESLYPKEPKEFLLAQMVDDLLELTLEMCGKDEKKTLRFPKVFYDGYVSCIITSAVTIQKNVIMANEIARGETIFLNPSGSLSTPGCALPPRSPSSDTLTRTATPTATMLRTPATGSAPLWQKLFEAC